MNHPSKRQIYTARAVGIPLTDKMKARYAAKAKADSETVCIAVEKPPAIKTTADIAAYCCKMCGVPLVQKPKSIRRHNRRRHGIRTETRTPNVKV